ncbi:MAG: hypothetical protein C0401_00950 [Anaerolinea sp.]|nr:hypothetical protein [Anaerolinea sp.]
MDKADINGEVWIAWSGEPEMVESCPDLMTIQIELDEPFYINRVIVFIDQTILGLGWNEIDAVELVGYTQESHAAVPSSPEPIQETPASGTPFNTGEKPAPTNFSGWMAGPVYQGWINIKINETRVEDLDKIMTINGTRSTGSWKPRPDYANTFIYKMGPKEMKAYISVTSNGIVYRKSISPNAYPTDYQLPTVTRATYEELDAIYKKDYVIPYPVMANILNSPGFLKEASYRQDDGKLITHFVWLAANGDRMGGFFYNGLLTGMAGLTFIPKE